MTTPEQRKNLIRKLLKGIESGDPASAAVVNESKYIQHNPQTQEGSEGLAAWRAALEATHNGAPVIHYQHLHRILAEGSFVLTVSEGTLAGAHTAFYDLYRLANSKVVEHWDTIEAVAPKSEWKNDNGKF